MEYSKLGELAVSRFILGSNPFTGFSHQNKERDAQMRSWYTRTRILDVLTDAQHFGVNTLIARADENMAACVKAHRDGGGTLQWLAQTCPEVGDHETCIQRSIEGGAVGVHIHGGVMDMLLAQGRLDEIPPVIDRIRAAGLVAGIAGHDPGVFTWAESVGLPVDYYMCSYYNPIPRTDKGEHLPGAEEKFRAADRDGMASVISSLPRPVVHYKVLAAGRNDPAEAFAFVRQTMRSGDMVCVGIFSGDGASLLQEDIELLGGTP